MPPPPTKFNGNPFVPIGTPIARVFPHKEHPLRPLDPVNDRSIQTNKFYANLLLDTRTLPAFPHPYAVWWSHTDNLLGFAVSHCVENQRVFGQDPNANPVQYYFNPAGIQSVNLGAIEFSPSNMKLATDSHGPMSVNVTLGVQDGPGQIQIPLASGIGFVTGIYSKLTAQIQSLVGFQAVEPCSPVDGILKYRLKLFNGVTWVAYISVPSGQQVSFSLKDNNHFVADHCVDGLVVQLASLPDGCDDSYDFAAGSYAKSASLSGTISDDGNTATYAIEYQLGGHSRSGRTLIFALPHQVESFTDAMKPRMTRAVLDSTTMGKMVGCVTDKLEMKEVLPHQMGLLPWATFSKHKGDADFDFRKYSAADLDLIHRTATDELNQDIKGQSCLDSMYFSGKGFDKFAFILLVTKYILRDDNLTKLGLQKLKDALAIFTANKQLNPLVYDTCWKGIISTAGYQDPNADFGNTYYNDHHFHYGYFFHAAAVIGQLDREFGGNWLAENKEWINTLVRDTANYGEDHEFPISRSFDWFVGHSWAKGLFLSGDGKDEESSSEDYHFAYGLKMWGLVSGDAAMESRGSLMLAVMRRAMNKYMLFASDNKEQPAQFIRNKVSGITFENKIDHATYFGLNLEYIQGIHMIPTTPASSFIRSPQFVKEEWEQVLQNHVNTVDSGWKGILKLNQALFDPAASYDFFSKGFQPQWLDGGMSLTWSLAYSKGI